jgi:hypothetical protein
LLGDGVTEWSFRALLTAAANATMPSDRLDSGGETDRAGCEGGVREAHESRFTIRNRKVTLRAVDGTIRMVMFIEIRPKAMWRRS